MKNNNTKSNFTDKFIDGLFELTQGAFPETVIFQAKKCLLDYLGAALAGATMLEDKGNKLLDYLGPTQGNSTIIGYNRKGTIQNAALLNGLSSHVAELDDGARFGMIHPGAPVISALLPVAEHEKLCGNNLLVGIIIGYEAAVRIASAIQPSHKDIGYHATGTCGTIGSAIGVASALRFTREQMKDTLSAASTGASGILKVLENGSELKPYNAGRAALCGLLAAFMGRAGFKGPDDILGGDRGFIAIVADECDKSCLTMHQGEQFGIEKIYVKPYAACRFCHPAIEAALNIRSRGELCPERIRSIKVITHQWAVSGHDHTQVQGAASAKMSIPYSMAVALVTGRAGIEEFLPERIKDPIVTSLAQKVRVIPDSELTLLTPAKRPDIVEIYTHDDECYTQRVDLPKGEPENPLTEDEIKEKFMELAVYGKKTTEEAQEIIRRVWNVENDLEGLFSLLKPWE